MSTSIRFPRFASLIGLGLAGLTLMSLLAGCGKKEEGESAAGAAAAGQESGARVETGSVVVSVDGTEIRQSEVDRVFETLKSRGVPPDPEVEGVTPDEKLRNTVVKLLVEQALLLNAAKKEGMTVGQEEVDLRYNQTVMESGGIEAFQQRVGEAGMTVDQVRHEMGEEMLLRKYFGSKVSQNPTITPEDKRAFFDAHPEMFGPQPEVNAQHILFSVKPEMDEMARAELLAKVKGVRDELGKGGDFAALAAQHSEDPGSAQQGGSLGWFRRGQMVAPFDSAAFALDPGQISDPILTQFGYHIIKVNERRTTEPRQFEQVEPMLQGYVAQEKMNQASKALVDSLRQASRIDYK